MKRFAMKRFAPWSLLLCALALQLSSACGTGTHNTRPGLAASAPSASGQYKSTGSTSSDQRTLRASLSSPTRASQSPSAACSAPRCSDVSSN